MAQKTTPCEKKAVPAPIPKLAVTMGVTNDFRNIIPTVRREYRTSIWRRGRSQQVPNPVNKGGGDQVSQLHSRPGTAVQRRWCVAVHYRGEVESPGALPGVSVAVNASELRLRQQHSMWYSQGGSS
ncbi:hypothetical protein TNCV_4956961 [Trichonephila clavipes]|nr:hypothetical protein TNCV_4956961 [Trichonephila clavipes]